NGSEVETACDDAFQKALFGGHDMPRQLQCCLGDRIGTVIALIERNCFNDFPRDRLLSLERWNKNCIEEEIGYLRLHGLRHKAWLRIKSITAKGIAKIAISEKTKHHRRYANVAGKMSIATDDVIRDNS